MLSFLTAAGCERLSDLKKNVPKFIMFIFNVISFEDLGFSKCFLKSYNADLVGWFKKLIVQKLIFIYFTFAVRPK